jgi:RNA polymerase sigma-70 factor (ECF subfamily)
MKPADADGERRMTLASAFSSHSPPLDASELNDLVLRSRNGDLESFDRLVGEYYGLTYRLAYRIIGDQSAAEDATQEIFIKAWRNMSRFREAARFSTWLHSIAVNHCLDASRQRRREESRIHPSAPMDAEESPRIIGASSPDDQWSLSLTLRDAIRRLPEKLRVAVTLRYYMEYSVNDIAAALDLPPNTVRSRIYLAMKRLKTVLATL